MKIRAFLVGNGIAVGLFATRMVLLTLAYAIERAGGPPSSVRPRPKKV